MSEVTRIQKPKLVEAVADRYGVDADKMLTTLKSTAFRGANNISNEQMMSLLIVANQYELNPFTKEIYAFPDKGSIIPVVSVDGWSRIMNSHPQMDGIEFDYSPETLEFDGKTCHEWIDCIIYRKDRSRPIKVREFFNEVCKKTGPWQSHPNRMHRHKAEIQCARIAFGFAGIYDVDEAERIAESSNVVDITPAPPLPTCNDEQKAFYHQLIADNNAIEFYAFMNALPESVRNDLHNSFEKGEKTRGKATANDLYTSGRAEYETYLSSFFGAISDGDTLAFSENVAELPESVIEAIAVELGDEFTQMLNEVKEQE